MGTRRLLTICAASTALGLVAAGLIGVAPADTPTVTTRTVSVQGTASVPIDPAASGDAANTAYRSAMAAALADAASKAQFLASQAGATVGAVQSLAEQGGGVDCGDNSYEGVYPDIGYSSGGGVGSLLSASKPAPAPRAPNAAPKTTHKHKRKPRKRADAAAAVTCQVSAQVAAVYALS